MRFKLTSLAAVSSACVAAVMCVASVQADPLSCNLSAYKAAPGLTAVVEGPALALTWDGDANGEVRMRLSINGGTPTIQDVSVRKKGGSWGTVASNLTPEYRVVSGWGRLAPARSGSVSGAERGVRRSHAGNPRQVQVGRLLGRAAARTGR